MKKFLLLISFLFLSNFAYADTLTFVQISDVHLPQSDYMYYEGRNLSLADENLKKAVSSINEKNDVEFVFFTGDSVDRSFSEIYDRFFNILSKLKKPYYIALGNHDVNSIDGLNKKETLELLNKKTTYKQKDASYVVELNSDFIAIMLDGTFDEGLSSKGYFKKSTLNWFESMLEKYSDKNVLIFQHFAVVEPKKEFFYKYPHYIINKREYVKILKKYKNIVLISSGHYHEEGEFEKYGVKHFSTPALFEIPSKSRYVQIDYDKNKINKITTKLIQN